MSEVADVTAELNRRFKDEASIVRSFGTLRIAKGTKVYWRQIGEGDVFIGTESVHVNSRYANGFGIETPNDCCYLVVKKIRKRPDKGGGETEYRMQLSKEAGVANPANRYERVLSIPLFSHKEDHRGMICFPDTEKTEICIKTEDDSYSPDPFMWEESSSTSSVSPLDTSSAEQHQHVVYEFCRCSKHQGLHSISPALFCPACAGKSTGDDPIFDKYSLNHDLDGNPITCWASSLHHDDASCDCGQIFSVSLPLKGSDCPYSIFRRNVLCSPSNSFEEAVTALGEIMADVCQCYTRTDYKEVDGMHKGWDGEHIPGTNIYCPLCKQALVNQ